MATWKKVVVSGSNISQLVNDSNYLLTIGDSVVSSSAQIALGGDLTGTAANAQLGIGVVTNTEVAANAAIAYTKVDFVGSTILSGSVVTDLSSSLASRLTTDEANIASNTSAIASNSASFAARLATEEAASLSISSSFATRLTSDEANITALQSWSSSLDSTYATDAQLAAVSASAATRAAADELALSTLSGSLSTRLTTDESLIASNSASFASRLTSDEQKYNAYTSSFVTTTLNVLGNSAVTGAFGVVGPTVLQDNLTVQGDLTVNGTVTTFNTQNLNVEDRFILLASGSSALGDAGLIFQSDANGTGPALYLEATSTGTHGRMAMATTVSSTATTATPAAYVNTTEIGAGAPPLAPTFGDTTNGFGNIFINPTSGDIFIYA
jgi:hypothetical protein